MNSNRKFIRRLLGPTAARYAWIIVVLPFLFANLSAFRSILSTDVYLSSASVRVGGTSIDVALSAVDTTAGRRSRRELEVARSRETIVSAAIPAGAVVGARLDGSNEIILLEARAPSAALAQRAAEAYTKAYLVESVKKRAEGFNSAAASVQRRLDFAQAELANATANDRPFLQDRVDELRGQIFGLRAAAVNAADSEVELSEPASLPSSPINRPVISSALIGLIFGIGVSAVVVLALDFGEKQRLTLDDITAFRPDIRILGTVSARNLESATMTGFAIRSAAESSSSTVICFAFIGSRLRPNKVVRGLCVAVNAIGWRSLQLRLRPDSGLPGIGIITEKSDSWGLEIPPHESEENGRRAIRDAMKEHDIQAVLVEGPEMTDPKSRPTALNLADSVVLVVDSASASKQSLSDGVRLLESFDCSVLGVLFISK